MPIINFHRANVRGAPRVRISSVMEKMNGTSPSSTAQTQAMAVTVTGRKSGPRGPLHKLSCGEVKVSSASATPTLITV